MEEARLELLSVLRDARSYLAQPENDFAWSSWKNSAEALSELDKVITAIEAHLPIQRGDVSVLFAATGPIQEVSMSSGWAWEFIDLSKRFDTAEQRFFGGNAL